MFEVSILKMGDNIIVPIQVELHDRAAQKVQDDILRKVEDIGSSGLVIDISAISVVDSFLGRLLSETARMARLLGAETVIVGMKKEVAITLIQLGMVFKDLHTAINIEDGIEFLERLKTEGLQPETETLE